MLLFIFLFVVFEGIATKQCNMVGHKNRGETTVFYTTFTKSNTTEFECNIQL